MLGHDEKGEPVPGISKREGDQSSMSEEEKTQARQQLEAIINGDVEGMVMLVVEESKSKDETHIHGTFFCHGIDETTRARVGLQALNIGPEHMLAWAIKLLTKKGD
jgi:hypothetical protein